MIAFAVAVVAAAACSDVTIDMFVEALVIIGVVSGIGVNVLVDANADVLAGTMTALEFANSEPFEEFSCWAAFDCWPLAALDRVSALQAWMPSYQV